MYLPNNFSVASDTTNAVSVTIGSNTENISAATLKTSLGLGAAAYKAVGAVASGNTGLVTGGTVYSHVVGAITSYDSEVLVTKYAQKATTLAGYGITDALPLTGGEIKGSLGVTVNITAQGGTFVNGLKVGGNDVIHSGNIGSQSVASADKLSTPRTIWGQSFDGTGNVSGNILLDNNIIYGSGYKNALDLTNGGFNIGYGYRNDTAIQYWGKSHYFVTGEKYGCIINSSGNVTIGSSDLAGTDYKLYVGGMAILKVNDANPAALYAENTNGKISLQTHTNRGVYDNTNSVWLIGTNGLDTFLMDGKVGIGTQLPTAKLHVNGNSYVNGTLNVANVIEANKGINIYGALTGYVSGTDSDTWSITNQGAASFASVKFGGGPSIYKNNNETSLVIAEKGVSTANYDKGTTLQVISKGAVGVEWSTAIYSYANSAYNVVGSGVGLSLGGYVKGNSDAPVGRGAGIAAVAEASWYNSTGLAFYVNHKESSTSDDFTEKMRLSCYGHLIPMHTASQTLGTSDKRWHNVYSSSLNVSGAASVGSLTINGATAATQDWVTNKGYATQTSVNNSLGSLSAEISAVDARIDALGTAAKKNWSGASSADTTNLVTIGWVESKLGGYATAASIPTKTSQLTNDSNFLSGHIETTVIGGGTGLVTGGAVYSFVEGSLSGYAKKATTLSGYGITDALPKSNPSVTGTLTVAGNVLPSNNNDTYALGSTNYRWSKLYVNGVDCTGTISSMTDISARGNVTAINGGLSGKTLSVSGAASVGSLTVGGAVHSNLNIGGYRIKTEGGDIYGVYDGLDKLMYFDASAAFCSAFVQTSDERLKNILNGDFRLSLGTMANAPLVQFDWNNRNDGKHHVGTIAQYWQGTLPEVVSKTQNGTLALAYGELGVAMGISLANILEDTNGRVTTVEEEIKTLKEENKRLKERVAELEAA